MQYIIDRFEENIAVLEDQNGNMKNIERKNLPAEAREGDVLIRENGEFRIDQKERQLREERIQDKFDKLFD